MISNTFSSRLNVEFRLPRMSVLCTAEYFLLNHLIFYKLKKNSRVEYRTLSVIVTADRSQMFDAVWLMVFNGSNVLWLKSGLRRSISDFRFSGIAGDLPWLVVSLLYFSPS